jgi:hypothetical protein
LIEDEFGVAIPAMSVRAKRLKGELQYQACDKMIWYTPASVPLKWELKVQRLDLHRSPGNIPHK